MNIQLLEESWNTLDKKITQNVLEKKKSVQTNKLFQNQKKILQLEYLSHIKSLSLILIALQNSQY